MVCISCIVPCFIHACVLRPNWENVFNTWLHDVLADLFESIEEIIGRSVIEGDDFCAFLARVLLHQCFDYLIVELRELLE